MARFSLRIFKNRAHTLVAACDYDLLGGTFREGKLKLEVKDSFYGGTLATVEDVMRAISCADVANLVGARVIEAAIKRGLVNREAVILIAGVPHVQIVKL